MEQSTEIQNEIPNDVKTDESDNSTSNADLDRFLEQTMESSNIDVDDSSNSVSTPANSEQNYVTPDITEEECVNWAMQGLEHTLNMVEEKTGEKITVSNFQVGLFAALVTPCMMKHGKSIKKFIEKQEFDDDSMMPEVLAAGGVGVIAVPSMMQLRTAKKRKQKAKAKAVKPNKDKGLEVVSGD